MGDIPTIVAIPWYMKSEYDRARTVFVDGDQLPESFLKWERQAEKIRKRYLSQGVMVVKAHIEISKFVSWCRARSLDINAHARNEFANTVAAEYGRKLY